MLRSPYWTTTWHNKQARPPITPAPSRPGLVVAMHICEFSLHNVKSPPTKHLPCQKITSKRCTFIQSSGMIGAKILRARDASPGTPSMSETTTDPPTQAFFKSPFLKPGTSRIGSFSPLPTNMHHLPARGPDVAQLIEVYTEKREEIRHAYIS